MKNTLIYAPKQYSLSQTDQSIFLAGSIEMGEAERWQDRLCKDLDEQGLVIFNPRREIWNPTLKQDINDPDFYEQVTWELTALESCQHIAMYFDPKTKSPITLLELGLFAYTGKLVVYCPHEFWRKGNVDIVCQRYGIPVHNKYDTFLLDIKYRLIQKKW